MRSEPLRTYRTKRDFDRTAEPHGTHRRARPGRLTFVIQRHHASHLHFDFRLELDGVLKSWAIPKGPSLSPSDKRLAVQVEDHPLEYGRFEGSIPHGEYGGGYVLRWDRGVWTPDGDPHEGLARGHLTFALEGERLRGRFALVRMRPRAGDKNHDWLLIKEQDAAARKQGIRAEVTRVAPVPSLAVFSPQLATLADVLPTGDGWGYEIKLDGYRALASVQHPKVEIHSREHKAWTARFPTLARALRALPVENAVFDGELAVVDEHGRTRFQDLQNALSGGESTKVVYFVFDLLFVDGFDLRDRSLAVRKSILASILDGAAHPLSYVAHLAKPKQAQAVFAEACRHDLEGMIAKRLDRPHHAGRSSAWVKVKCSKRQELVIVGYARGKGSRAGLGALLLGVHDGGRLRYAGKVGTGFSASLVRDLPKRLQKIAVAEPPVEGAPSLRGVTWVEPSMVCEVSFREWTHDGSLRQPSFVGLREDKGAKDVVMEEPERIDAAPRVANVVITHPTRVVDGSTGTTKLDLVRYLEAVAPRMLPYAEKRPLALVRCTGPVGDKCFFQRKKSPGMGGAVHTAKANGHDVLYVESVEGLVSLVQFGAIELHGWGSQLPRPEKPDWIVMDLDPDEALPFARVVDAALAVRDLFRTIGLESFVKTTGGKGLHVVAPIVAGYGWDAVKTLAHAIAMHLERGDPDRFTSNMGKKHRGGRIFVDYLRNGEGATAVLPYSPRTREGLPVAMPIAWTDVRHVDPHAFTVKTVPGLVRRRKRDPWADFFTTKQHVPASWAKLIP